MHAIVAKLLTFWACLGGSWVGKTVFRETILVEGGKGSRRWSLECFFTERDAEAHELRAAGAWGDELVDALMFALHEHFHREHFGELDSGLVDLFRDVQ